MLTHAPAVHLTSYFCACPRPRLRCCSITAPARFAFKIPEGLPLHAVGPLLCAGITTYAPLSRHVKKGDRVGVVGIGGLGHMALQYAAAMGCETWAISTSAGKEAEARRFGAGHFLVSSDPEAVKAARNSFDFILCCASGDFDTDLYMGLLKARRAFCLVGLPAVDSPVKVRASQAPRRTGCSGVHAGSGLGSSSCPVPAHS